MCITLHASRLTGTKIYAGEAKRDGKYVHVLGYANNAENNHHGPNAMVLPIPTLSFAKENAIDTRQFRGFLGDIAEATKEPNLFKSARGRGGDVTKGMRGLGAEVFAVGGYTVVTASDPMAIAEALDRVPANKRPELNQAVLDTFAENYPGWPIAVCCWDGSIKPEPLLFWYEPMMTDRLFAPALDAHGGRPPVRGEMVNVDHVVMFGSTLRPMGYTPVHYREMQRIPPADFMLLPPKAVGRAISDRTENGDFWYFTSSFEHAEAVENHEMPIPPTYRWFPTPGITFPKRSAAYGLGGWS